MKRFIPLFLGLLLPAYLPAGAYDAGTTSGQFWKLGLDARADAMAQAVVAIPDGPLEMLDNPAGLKEKGGGLQALELEWFGDVRAGAFAVEQAAGPLGSVGFSVGYLILPSQEITQQTGTGPDPRLNYSVVGSFQPSNLQAGVALARNFGGLRGGLGLKLQRQELGSDAAQALAADLGLLYRWGDFRFGFAAQNLGSAVSLRSDAFNLPALARLGAAYRDRDWPLLLSVEAALPADNQGAAAFGLEYRLVEALGLRAGYRYDGIFNPWSAGLGLRFGSLGLDLSTSPAGELGQTYHASLRWDWGNRPAPAAKPSAALSALGRDASGWTLGLKLGDPAGVAGWALYIRSPASGAYVWRAGGQGAPPAELRWAGTDSAGKALPEASYQAIAALSLKGGKTLYSNWAVLAPAPAAPPAAPASPAAPGMP